MYLKSKKSPVIFEYLDVVLYLKDYYSFRKKNQKNFSYDSWSEELGFSNRSFLRLIAIGKKKVTPKLADAICEKVFLQNDEKNYFFMLVQYSQTTSHKEKHIYGQKMMQILKNYNSPQIINNFEDLVSSPLLPRLLSLFSYKDITFTINSLTKILNVPEDVVINALKALQNFGLIQYSSVDEEVVWSSEVKTFKVPDSYGNINLAKFHEKSLLEAIAAFDKPKEMRRYKSVLLPMDKSELKEFNALLDAFAAEQMVRFNPKTYRGKRMYQANFNIYPVTEEIDSAV